MRNNEIRTQNDIDKLPKKDNSKERVRRFREKPKNDTTQKKKKNSLNIKQKKKKNKLKIGYTRRK